MFSAASCFMLLGESSLYGELLAGAIAVLIVLGQLFWKLRYKIFAKLRGHRPESEFGWGDAEPGGDGTVPVAPGAPKTAFEVFLEEAAGKGVRGGHAPAPRPIPIPAPVPVPAAPPAAPAAPCHRAGIAPPAATPALPDAAHPIAARIRADAQQSIVLAEILGPPKGLR